MTMAGQHERQLAFELGGATIIVAVREVWAGHVPPPREFLGVALIFGGLSAAAMFGEPWAKVAAALGGLILLTLALGTVSAHPDLLPGLSGLSSVAGPLYPGGKS